MPAPTPTPPSNYLVDMGLPSGTLWLSRDLDVTKQNGICDTPFTYEKSFYSWGNVEAHNPTKVDSFSPYDWGRANSNAPYYEGQVYGETKGNNLQGNIPISSEYDAARAILGTPWRMPSEADFEELFNNIVFINADGTEIDDSLVDKRVSVNGVMGIYVQSKLNGARLFFSCSGYGQNTTRSGREAAGYYWSATRKDGHTAYSLYFGSAAVNPKMGTLGRHLGFAIRPVQGGENRQAPIDEPTSNERSDENQR